MTPLAAYRAMKAEEAHEEPVPPTPRALPALDEVRAALPQGEGWSVRPSSRPGGFVLVLDFSAVGALESGDLFNSEGGWRARLYGGREIFDPATDFRVALNALFAHQ